MSNGTDVAYQLSAEEIADHIRWFLSNSNHEIEPDGGPFLAVSFDASESDDEPTVLELTVGTWDEEARVSGTQRFKLTVAPADPS